MHFGVFSNFRQMWKDWRENNCQPNFRRVSALHFTYMDCCPWGKQATFTLHQFWCGTSNFRHAYWWFCHSAVHLHNKKYFRFFLCSFLNSIPEIQRGRIAVLRGGNTPITCICMSPNLTESCQKLVHFTFYWNRSSVSSSMGGVWYLQRSKVFTWAFMAALNRKTVLNNR